MRRTRPLRPEQILYLTPPKSEAIRVSLIAWMDLRPGSWSAAFNLPAVDVLQLLLTDADYMRDFLSRYASGPRRAPHLREQQIRYVTLHWLADIAAGFGGELIG